MTLRNARLVVTIGAIIAIFQISHAQPRYVEIGSLPVPEGVERGEVFDPESRTIFSFIYWSRAGAGGNSSDVYSAKADTLAWVKTTSFPTQNYWGRGCARSGKLYFNGTIDAASVSRFASFGTDGLLGSWQNTTALPSANGYRSLHQSFVYADRVYILGGWHLDGQPAYSDVWYAPIQTGGILGSFAQTQSLPTGVASHSAVVSPGGLVYVVNDTNVYTGRIMLDGSISTWTTEPPISGLHHNNNGNTGAALLPNRLVIVDATTTFICGLDESGHVTGVESTLSNPGTFTQRSVFTVDGKIVVTATTGKIYRIDGLPAVPVTDFQNGSFELPGQAVLGAKAFLSAGDVRLPGWVVGGNGGAIHLFNGGTEIYPAADGVSHLLFNGGGGTPGTLIAQTFKTVVGTKYVLSFAVGRLGAGGGTLSMTATARAADGAVLGTVLALPPSQGYGAAQKLRFTATSPQTTLEFQDTSSGGIDSQDITLDAVSVLPEPGLTIRVSSVDICWESETGKSYQVQYRSALTGDQWNNIGQPVAGNGANQCITDVVPVGAPRRFYQLVTTP